MNSRIWCLRLVPSAVLAALTACTWGPPGYMPPVQVVMNAQPQQNDSFSPLMTCAGQRGLAVQRFGELLQVHLDPQTMLEYHYDNNRNLVMSARFLQPLPPVVRAERSELAHARGNEIFACAGYGTPVYLGATEPAAPPPQVYAAQPTPAPAPPAPMWNGQAFANRPMCGRLDTCVSEVSREACPPGDQRCLEGFRMRAGQETECREGLERVARHIEELRRQRPNLVLPQTCLAPNEPEPMARQQPMGPSCNQLQNCYKDLTDEACRARNPHCNVQYQMRDHSEGACEMALRELVSHVDDIRRNNPGFVLPQSCHPPR